jgi:hypothetical protein
MDERLLLFSRRGVGPVSIPSQTGRSKSEGSVSNFWSRTREPRLCTDREPNGIGGPMCQEVRGAWKHSSSREQG